MIRKLLICILWLTPVLTHGQLDLIVHKIEHADLSDQSEIKALLQDPRGYMWIGTRNGLFRYDGYDLDVYLNDPGTSKSLSSILIHSLALDTNDRLWIGTPAGIYQYLDLASDKVRLLQFTKDKASDSQYWINDIHIDPNGKHWLATYSGLLNYQPGDSAFVGWAHPRTGDTLAANLNFILPLNDHLLLTGGTGSDLFLINTWNQKIEAISKNKIGIESENQIYCALLDWLGRLWLGTDQGLFRSTLGSELSKIHFKRTTNSFNQPVKLLHRLQDNSVLAGSSDGIKIFDTTDQLVYRNSQIKNAEAAYIDESHLIWIGTIGSGLFTLQRRIKDFKNIEADQEGEVKLSNPNVTGFWEDEAGLIWVGTKAGLNVYDPKLHSLLDLKPYLDLNHPLRNVYVTQLEPDSKGNLWIGTRAGGFFFLPAARSLARFQNIESHEVDEKGMIEGEYPKTASLFAHDRDGHTWVGTLSTGLHRFDSSRRETLRLISHKRNNESLPIDGAADLYFDHGSNKLLIATLGRGLAILDLHQKLDQHATFEVYQHIEGDSCSLSSNTIMSIVPDDQGHFYLCTYQVASISLI
ncbi:MAG: hypothetical protein IPL46_19935 [Saprospiraceae bacterium]|nr:hypothetical protein [Saprospiraceae bacterium]